MAGGGLNRFPAELDDLPVDPVIVGGHNQAVQGRGPPRPLVHVLNHRSAGNIGQDLSGQTGGSVARWDNSVNFHKKAFSPQRSQRKQRKKLENWNVGMMEPWNIGKTNFLPTIPSFHFSIIPFRIL
jgi:hypothetical protein